MNDTVGSSCGTPAAAADPDPPGACHHAAAVVSTDQELVQVALPYLAEGRRRGDLTMLACPAATTLLLRDELAAAGLTVHVERSPTDWGVRPPDLFARWRRFADEAARRGSGQLRVFAQPLLPVEAESLSEHLRTEAVANQVLADLPMRVLCAYDTRQAPAAVVGDARRTHPQLVTPAGWARSLAYEPPADFVRRLSSPTRALESTPPVFAVDDAPSLASLRRSLGAALAGVVADDDLRDDLHLALSEVAANAFRHGSRPVSARLWAGEGRLVCTITDSGHTFDDPLAGFVPAHGFDLSQGGMGLWLARKLWDHVDLLRGAAGFTVRLSTGL